MKTRLLHLWEVLNSSYWFVPCVMLVAAIALAFGTIAVDRSVFTGPAGARWAYAGGAEGARLMLSTVGGSVITVAGVVFSITIAALTQASSQYGPRLLRNFMRDRGNQVVLGTFVATFIYCLLVLRTVQGDEEGRAFVPHVSVTTAVVMAVASLVVLIYFIHHVSSSMQAPVIIATVGRDLDEAIDRMFPEDLGTGGPAPPDLAPGRHPDAQSAWPAGFAERARPVPSGESGYVQAIDQDGLMALAVGRDLLVCLTCRPGDFVIAGSPLAFVAPAGSQDGHAAAPAGATGSVAGGDHASHDSLCDAVNAAFFTGKRRTPEQDAEFALHQIVEIAVRALSPAVNDPFTAVTCVDWIAAALCRLAKADEHSPYRYDHAGRLRVVAEVTDFDGFADAGFNQIRQYGAASVSVSLRMLEAIASIAPRMRNDAQRDVLARHARMIVCGAESIAVEKMDRADLRGRYEVAMKALDRADAAVLV